MSTHALASVCQNCETPLTGSFCVTCGQKAETHRFTFMHLLHEIPHSIFHVEKGFFFTMRELFKQPGETIRNFVGGKRVRYFPPLTYFILLLGFSFFLQSSFHIAEKAIAFAGPAMEKNVMTKYIRNGSFQVWAKYVQYLFIPFLSFVTFLIYRKSRAFNYTEHIIGHLYIYGQKSIISILALPLYFVLNPTLSSTINIFVETILVAWMYGSLFEPREKKPMRFFIGLGVYLITLVSVVVLVILLILIAIFVFNLHISDFKAD
jgi:hypothetical protein